MLGHSLRKGNQGRRGRGEGRGRRRRRGKEKRICASSTCECYYFCIAILTFIFSKAQVTDASYQVASFGKSTGVSNLRKHLIKDHLEDWVKACAELKIPITAASALQHIRELQGLESDETDHPASQRRHL